MDRRWAPAAAAAVVLVATVTLAVTVEPAAAAGLRALSRRLPCWPHELRWSGLSEVA